MTARSHSPAAWRGRARYTAPRSLGVALMLACALAAAPARAQGPRSTLVVGVADARNGAPLQGAEIYLPDVERVAHTNWIGEARFPGLFSGVYRIRVRRVGFVVSELQLLVRGDTSGAVFMLQPVVTKLATVHVRARPVLDISNEFEMRRHIGVGRYLTADDLVNEQGHDFAVVAAQHFPGLQIVAGRGGQLQLATRRGSCGTDTMYEVLPAGPGRTGALRGTQGQSNMVGGVGSGSRTDAGQTATSQGSCFSEHPCHVKLFLDNLPLAETDIGVIKTEDLYGVEYYATGDAPPQYHTDGAACGVMLLWSRSGGDSGG